MNGHGARWAPDPSGKHRLRYWDGVGWTPHLSDGVATYLDPEPWQIPTNGVPGGSAQREHQRRAERAAARASTAGVASWQAGAIGEERADFLQREVGHSTILLHDRDVPGTQGNIDLLAVTRTGVWVIGAKNYKGNVELREYGTPEQPDQRLYVNRWNQTKLADKMQWQVDQVRAALGDVPVAVVPAICFVDTRGRRPDRSGSPACGSPTRSTSPTC